MNRAHSSQAPGERRGVTLVELIVAVIILSIGLLAIVGSSGAIARGLGESRTDNLAAYAAESRMETLAGSACAGLTLATPTTVTSRGVTETYVVTDAGNNTRLIVDSISWNTRRGTRRQVFTTIIPCRTGA